MLRVAAACLASLAAAASGHALPGAARPAARFLIFVAPLGPDAARAPHGLEVVDRGGHVLRVVAATRFGTVGRWSPNGRMLAWKDPAGVHVENADGSGARLLVPTQASCKTCQALSFVWSPDTRSLVVGSAGRKGNELRLVPIDGSAATTLATSSTPGAFFTPAFWTSNGRTLIYSEAGTTLSFPGAVIRALTRATGRARTLWRTPQAQGADAPLISPNGRDWASIRELDEYHRQLRIVDRVTGTATVVPGVDPTNLVAWSPDSRVLAVVARGWHVLTVGADGTVRRNVGPGRQVYWSRDGELLVLRAASNQVWSAGGDGRPEKLLFRLPRNAFVVSLDAD